MRLLPLLVPLATLMASEPSVLQVDADLPLADATTAAVRIHYPASSADPCPVILFSHGLGGSRTGYGHLGRAWAAAGFVVILPTHPGSDTETFRTLRPAELAQALRRATRDPQVAAGRPRLIRQIIDVLPDIGSAVPALARRVDVQRIGVGGHSYGGWTTLAVAGMLVQGRSVADPRPRAFLALSPPGPGTTVHPEALYAACTRPLLVMTGTDDHQPRFLGGGAGANGGAWRRQVFDLLPPGQAFLLWLDGARHCTASAGAGHQLTGEPAPDPDQVAAVATVTAAWWRSTLRGDPAATRWLADPATPARLGPWAHLATR